MCRRPPPNHLLPSTPLPAGGYNEAREEARPGTPAPITAAALSQGLLQKRVAWPPPPPSPYLPQPLALAQLATLFLTPPAPVVAPAGSALRGRLLGSLPPLSFLKFKIHLSQEEGKLLPLKPLALSSKSSLLRRRRLLAPAGPGVTSEVGGGGRLRVCPPSQPWHPAALQLLGLGESGEPCMPPLKHGQHGVRVPLKPPPPSLAELAGASLLLACRSLATCLLHAHCLLAACSPFACHLLAHTDLVQKGGSPCGIDALVSPPVWHGMGACTPTHPPLPCTQQGLRPSLMRCRHTVVFI